MAVVMKPTYDGKVSKPDESSDITSSLPSLQFESALSDEELDLLVLRKRSHALTVSACAQATYFVSSLNEARQIKAELRNPIQKRTNRLLQEVNPRDPLLVGIIGCGRLGSHLVNCLLTFGEVNAEDIKVSTRRPETLVALKEKGIVCTSDNAKLSSSVHLLFLCVLPSQLSGVCEEIKGRISPHCTIYSMVSSISVSRVKQLLNCSNVLKPDFSYAPMSGDLPWDYNLEILQAFEVPVMIEKTCPLSRNKKGSLVRTSEKFAEAMMYAFVNMCTTLRLSRQEAVDVVRGVMLGQTSEDQFEQNLSVQDFISEIPEDSKLFPVFDLCKVNSEETPLSHKLKESTEIREALINHYCDVFAQYIIWKNYSLGGAKLG